MRNIDFLKGLYESLISGDITGEEYREMKQSYETKIADLLAVKDFSRFSRNTMDSREEHGDTAMYFMTVSGCIDHTSQYFDREWDEQQSKWVHHHPAEAELDELIPKIARL